MAEDRKGWTRGKVRDEGGKEWMGQRRRAAPRRSELLWAWAVELYE